MKLLFSVKPDWELWLRQSLAGCGHDLNFAEFTPEALAAHDFVVPLVMPDLHWLDQHRHLLPPAQHRLPIPTAALLTLCHDKLLLNRRLIELGFGAHIPELGLAGQGRYPYMLKLRKSGWGRNCHPITSPEVERQFEQQLAKPGFFSQALVPACRERAAHLLMRGGRLRASVTIEAEFAHAQAVLGPDKPLRRPRVDGAAEDALWERVLAALGFEGLCCIDYRMQDGHPFLLEINPRFGGTLSGNFRAMLPALEG